MQPEIESIERTIREGIPGASARVEHGERSTPGGVDHVVSLTLGGVHLRLLAEWVNSPSTPLLRHKAHELRKRVHGTPGALPMIMASYLTKSQQEWLRGAGVAYLDLEGNAWVEHKGVYVDRVGPRVASLRKQSSPNPFSDKASIVVRQLLGSSKPLGVRELAGLTGLSAGYVSKVVNRLSELGYVSDKDAGKATVTDPGVVLRDWTNAYDYAKNRMTGFFCKARDATEVIACIRGFSPLSDYALTTQAGAYLVAPYASFDRVDVYVSGLSVVEGLVAGLGLEPVERGANLFLGEPYYQHSAFFGVREIDGLRVVSDLQLYLDLYRYPHRGPEQAQHLLETWMAGATLRPGEAVLGAEGSAPSKLRRG